MSPRLVFTPGNHSYSLDGKRVPSVTALKNVANVDNGGLIGGAAKAVAEWSVAHLELAAVQGEESWKRDAAGSYRAKWDQSRDQGTQVHSIAQRLIYGDPVATDDPDTGEPYADDVIRMGEQCARFMDAWDVTPDTALVEACVFHEELRYAGTFDLHATLRGGDKWLIDYKTGASGVWTDTALQLTAYARATHVQIGNTDLRMPPTHHMAALAVRPDRWELLPIYPKSETWDAIVGALTVIPFTKLKRDDLIGSALPVPDGWLEPTS